MKQSKKLIIIFILAAQLFVEVKSYSLYETLGVQQEATEQQIINAYLEKRNGIQNQKFDADKPNERNSKLHILRNAFETLIDQDTRQIYDLLLNNDPIIFLDPKYEMFRREEPEPNIPYQIGHLSAQMAGNFPTWIPDAYLQLLDREFKRFNKARLIYNSAEHGTNFHEHVDGYKNTLTIMRTKQTGSNPETHVSFNGIFNDREWNGMPQLKYSKNIFMFNIEDINEHEAVMHRRPETPNYNAAIQTNSDYGPNMVNGFFVPRQFLNHKGTNLGCKDYFLPNHKINPDRELGDADAELDETFFKVPFFDVTHMATWELRYE